MAPVGMMLQPKECNNFVLQTQPRPAAGAHELVYMPTIQA